MKLIIAKAILIIASTPIIILIGAAIWEDIKKMSWKEIRDNSIIIIILSTLIWAIMTVLGV